MRSLRHLLARLAVGAAALIIAIFAMAAPAAAAPGNSAAAKACQKGGWTQLATTEDPYSAFPNQSACLSYAAGGGTLTSLRVSPHADVAIGPFNGSVCPVTFTLEDGESGQWYRILAATNDGASFTPLLRDPGYLTFHGGLYAQWRIASAVAYEYDPLTNVSGDEIPVVLPASTLCEG